VTGPAGFQPGDDVAPAPGYYPDPDGTPGYVRWWNGISWSDVGTPAGPGVAVQHSPLLEKPASSASSSGVIGTLEEPRTRPRRGVGWVLGLCLVGLAVIVGIGLVVSKSGDEPTPAAETPPSSASAQPRGPAFPPGTVRIIDENAGISYPHLGDGWFEWNLIPQIETTTTAGQYFTTQEITPDSGSFIAQCTSGALAEGYGWAGPSTLKDTLAAVADNVRGNYYPAPNERAVLHDETRTVDGHQAWLYEFQLSWHKPGWDATGERAALLLIDVGRPAPALLYISIPNTHAELWGLIDVALDGVQVL
jgi:hypothetical protein